MEDEIPKETLYAILIAASLDDTSVFYGKDPGWTKEIYTKKNFHAECVDNHK